MWIGSNKSSANKKAYSIKNKKMISWKPGYNWTFREKSVKKN